MNKFRVALATVIAGAAMLASAVATLAAPGLITSNVNVRTGPGANYAVVGTLRTGTGVDVTQCTGGWCYVSAGDARGWVSANYVGKPPQPAPTPPAPTEPSINFGIQIGPDGKPSVNFGVNQPQPQQPRPPRPQPLPLPEPVDDTAQACFYSGTNFTGSSFCVEEGQTVRALRPNWNDRIRSVELLNGATVDICAERNLAGICQTLTRDRSRLAPQLDRDISSLEVY